MTIILATNALPKTLLITHIYMNTLKKFPVTFRFLLFSSSPLRSLSHFQEQSRRGTPRKKLILTFQPAFPLKLSIALVPKQRASIKKKTHEDKILAQLHYSTASPLSSSSRLICTHRRKFLCEKGRSSVRMKQNIFSLILPTSTCPEFSAVSPMLSHHYFFVTASHIAYLSIMFHQLERFIYKMYEMDIT